MTQFHEGQEVEVYSDRWITNGHCWRKAKIDQRPRCEADRWRVQFPDGTCAVFSAEHIRAWPQGYLAEVDTEMKARDAKPLGERWKDPREFVYAESKMFPFVGDRRRTTD